MEEEKNAVPWKHYRDYYFLSQEDYDNIGTSSCFRVQCKLCLPALKTIGTNRSSSSNLRKHMKSIHPVELLEMEKRLSVEGLNVNRRKRIGDGKDGLEEKGQWKRLKTDELLGGEKELLFQLVEEYTAALGCDPKEGDEDQERRLMWKSLTCTFNEISCGPERTQEQLKNIWEKFNNESKGNEEKHFRPRILSTVSKMEKGDNESYSEGITWENAVQSDTGEMEDDDMGHPIIVTDENGSYASMQVSFQDDSSSRQNVYKQVRNNNSADLKKHSEVELRLREQLVSDQKVRLQGLKQQMDLKKEILREELEHQRRKNKMEFVHRKLLNSMERMMKQEAYRAEERRKEEKHAVEMSILRMSARLSPQMRWKIPGTNRNFVSAGASISPSPSRKISQDDAIQETGSPSSSIEKVAKPLPPEKKIILLQNVPHSEAYEIVQEHNGTMVKLTD